MQIKGEMKFSPSKKLIRREKSADQKEKNLFAGRGGVVGSGHKERPRGERLRGGGGKKAQRLPGPKWPYTSPPIEKKGGS